MISLALIKGVEAIAILVVLAVGAALLTWLERRMLGVWQDRYGPNRVGPFGLLQVVADMIKIFTKEDWIPPFADKFVFVVAPAVIMSTLLLAYAVVPVAPGFGVVDLNIGLLFFMAMSSLAVYSVMLGGWASNSKYSLLGGLRSSAQMISYEVFMGLALMGVVINAGSFSLRDIVESQQAPVCFSHGVCIPGWYFISQAIGMLVFLIAGIAETHRTPFDLPEAEHELAAGFHTEYSGMKFGMFFIGEYVGVILISSMLTTLYFGGWLGPTFGPAWLQAIQPMMWFGFKTFGFVLFFILMRAALPRPRYDQLMAYGWKVMLPLALINLVVTGGVVLARA